MEKRVLFLCTGNLCRSPLAEGILKKMLADRNIRSITVSSAGTFALRGRPAADLAVEVAAERGVDLCRHSTCHLTPQLLDEADLVLCVEKDHMVEADVVRKDTCGKYRMLSDFGPRHMRGHDIEDPYGAPKDSFAAAYEKIEACVEGVCKHVLQNWT